MGETILFMAISFVLGAWMGVRASDRKWREKGDHEYMNRMASGGALYIVKRERP